MLLDFPKVTKNEAEITMLKPKISTVEVWFPAKTIVALAEAAQHMHIERLQLWNDRI